MNLLFFKKHPSPRYDASRYTPVIRCSICTGEQVACFRENTTGRLEEIMLISSPRDIDLFRSQYGISGPVEKIY